jgi:hypothetical protein
MVYHDADVGHEVIDGHEDNVVQQVLPVREVARRGIVVGVDADSRTTAAGRR